MVKLPPTQIRVKKASDIFDISPKLLKASSDKIIEPLTFLINGTIKKVVIPQKLKMTVFYPTHNKESKIKVFNYRHISILPLTSKIYKKLIHEHLIDFFNKHEIIYKHKFGFQRGKSTEDAVFDLLYNIVPALERKTRLVQFFKIFQRHSML